MHATKLHVPKLIAHRGAPRVAPENTLSSIREARKLGATWVEFDVRLTKDDELICFHDNTLERTTNGSGYVYDYTFSALQQLDAGSWFSPKYRGEEIPTFSQMASLVMELGLGMNIEIKPDERRVIETAEKTIATLKKLNIAPSDKILISSFYLEATQHVVKIAPEYFTGLLLEDINSAWQQQADSIYAQTVHISKQKINKTIVDEIHATNRLVLTYTVNELDDAKKLFELGVDSIFSDVTTLLGE